jgi:hypothetical protein
MKRGKGFARPQLVRPAQPVYAPVKTSAVMARIVTDFVLRVDKECVLQHRAYMALVRTLPCAHCGKRGPSQFCHRDMGKGMGIKTDAREGFPGCPSCHVLLGSTGKIPREERRELELEYGRKTRELLLRVGAWPPGLPPWPGDKNMTLSKC